jgi:hypothetical protein
MESIEGFGIFLDDLDLDLDSRADIGSPPPISFEIEDKESIVPNIGIG